MAHYNIDPSVDMLSGCIGLSHSKINQSVTSLSSPTFVTVNAASGEIDDMSYTSTDVMGIRAESISFPRIRVKAHYDTLGEPPWNTMYDDFEGIQQKYYVDGEWSHQYIGGGDTWPVAWGVRTVVNNPFTGGEYKNSTYTVMELRASGLWTNNGGVRGGQVDVLSYSFMPPIYVDKITATGYMCIGNDQAPNIKMKLCSGTCDANGYQFLHGLVQYNIISANCIVISGTNTWNPEKSATVTFITTNLSGVLSSAAGELLGDECRVLYIYKA